MKDHRGNEMQEHDIVVFAEGSRSYHGLRSGVITAFTAKSVRIDGGYLKHPSKVVSLCAWRRSLNGEAGE